MQVVLDDVVESRFSLPNNKICNVLYRLWSLNANLEELMTEQLEFVLKTSNFCLDNCFFTLKPYI